MHTLKKVTLITALAISVTTGPAAAELRTETVEYAVGEQTFTGYLTWDDEDEGKRPGILVVHEWWGHNEFARDQAEKLAAAGYTALALDMYGAGKVADHPDDAKTFMAEATRNMEQMRARFLAAREVLQQHHTVDPERIAAQGYCFGGAVVLNMARLGVDLKGVVSYHGALASPLRAEPGKVTAQIQVYTGGADKMVPSEQVADLVREMQDAGVDLTLTVFPGVLHSFTNPEADRIAREFNMPVGYDEEAAQRAWEGTLRFYERLFAR